jgi:hypothetical protein
MFAYSREQIAYPQVERDLSDQSWIASSEVRHETFIDIPFVSAGACRARLRFPGWRVAWEFDGRIGRGIDRRPRSDRIGRGIDRRPRGDRRPRSDRRARSDRIDERIDRRPRSARTEQPVGWQPLRERRNGARVRTGRDQPRGSDGA